MGKGIVTFRLKSTKREALDTIAAILGCDRSHVLTEAIDAYLDAHRWQVRHIKKGLRQAKSGQFASEREVARALAGKGSGTNRTVAKGAIDSMRRSLAERAEDLKAFRERAKEPNLAFKDILQDLKRRRRV